MAVSGLTGTAPDGMTDENRYAKIEHLATEIDVWPHRVLNADADREGTEEFHGRFGIQDGQVSLLGGFFGRGG
jgi:hypothetical protein